MRPIFLAPATSRKLIAIANQPGRLSKTPSIFICYAWEDSLKQTALTQWIKQLATRFRSGGFIVFVDLTHNMNAGSVRRFIEKIMHVTFIVVVGSPLLVEKNADENHVVGQELDLISVRHRANRRCVFPILMEGRYEDAFPPFLADQSKTDCSTSTQYKKGIVAVMATMNRLLERPISDPKLSVSGMRPDQILAVNPPFISFDHTNLGCYARASELAKLESILMAPDQPDRVVLHGISGTGKSHIARHYATKFHATWYDFVWRIAVTDSQSGLPQFSDQQAESMPLVNLKSGLKRLANTLGIRQPAPDLDTVDLVSRTDPQQTSLTLLLDILNDYPRPFLIIIDGAPTPELLDQMAQFFPLANGHLIITSPHSGWGSSSVLDQPGSQLKLIAVNPLDESGCQQFVQEATGLFNKPSQQAISLASRTYGLPLFLGRFVERLKIELAKHPESEDAIITNLLQTLPEATQFDISGIFDNTVRFFSNVFWMPPTPTYGKVVARHCLECLIWFDISQIPEWFVSLYIQKFQPQSITAPQLINTLSDWALVGRNYEQQTLSILPIIRASVRAKSQQSTHHFYIATDLLYTAAQTMDGPVPKASLASHLHALLGYSNSVQRIIPPPFPLRHPTYNPFNFSNFKLISDQELVLMTPQFFDLCLMFGDYHQQVGEYDLSEVLLEQALRIAIHLISAPSLTLAKLLRTAAITRMACGKLEEAQVAAIDGLKACFPLPNPAAISDAHMVMGDVARARRHAQAARKSYTQALDLMGQPTSHPVMSSLHFKIGHTYMSEGKYDDAVSAYSLGVDCANPLPQPDRLLGLGRGYYYLANAHQKYKKYEVALPCLENALSNLSQFYPDQRHHRLASAHRLKGKIHLRLGHYVLSRQHLDQSVEISQRCFGESHYFVAHSLRLLGQLAIREKRLRDADTCLKDAYAIYMRFPQLTHKQRGVCEDLAYLWHRLFRSAPDAFDWYQKAWITLRQDAIWPQQIDQRRALRLLQGLHETKTSEDLWIYEQSGFVNFEYVETPVGILEPESFLRAGLRHEIFGEVDQAIDTYKTVLRLYKAGQAGTLEAVSYTKTQCAHMALKIGELYTQKQGWTTAELYLDEAVQFLELAQPDTDQLAMLEKIIQCYMTARYFHKGLRHITRLIDLRSVEDAPHAHTLALISNLNIQAELLVKLGQPTQAYTAVCKATSLQKRHLTALHFEQARSYHLLGQICIHYGDTHQAIIFWKLALLVFQRIRPTKHHRYFLEAKILIDLARRYDDMGLTDSVHFAKRTWDYLKVPPENPRVPDIRLQAFRILIQYYHRQKNTSAIGKLFTQLFFMMPDIDDFVLAKLYERMIDIDPDPQHILDARVAIQDSLDDTSLTAENTARRLLVSAKLDRIIGLVDQARIDLGYVIRVFESRLSSKLDIDLVKAYLLYSDLFTDQQATTYVADAYFIANIICKPGDSLRVEAAKKWAMIDAELRSQLAKNQTLFFDRPLPNFNALHARNSYLTFIQDAMSTQQSRLETLSNLIPDMAANREDTTIRTKYIHLIGQVLHAYKLPYGFFQILKGIRIALVTADSDSVPHPLSKLERQFSVQIKAARGLQTEDVIPYINPTALPWWRRGANFIYGPHLWSPRGSL